MISVCKQIHKYMAMKNWIKMYSNFFCQKKQKKKTSIKPLISIYFPEKISTAIISRKDSTLIYPFSPL